MKKLYLLGLMGSIFQLTAYGAADLGSLAGKTFRGAGLVAEPIHLTSKSPLQPFDTRTCPYDDEWAFTKTAPLGQTPNHFTWAVQVHEKRVMCNGEIDSEYNVFQVANNGDLEVYNPEGTLLAAGKCVAAGDSGEDCSYQFNSGVLVAGIKKEGILQIMQKGTNGPTQIILSERNTSDDSFSSYTTLSVLNYLPPNR